MPLSAVPPGRSVVLRRIRSGCVLGLHLAAMGFVPGVPLDVRQNTGNGPVIVGLKGTRVMLGRGMAEKMSVE